jgi:hypothetical protein
MENKIRIMPEFGGTDVDEMSIDYVKSISTYIT